ncbi:Ger(x)C family spore germination protein [Brevibacillus sp. GCM10020057]|uniref:Ger(x)C family spore germination protein n=1 Tax=Brevibacillus sp. GCM10020057 TaxID=3317327 RepID=UPI00363BC5D0
MRGKWRNWRVFCLLTGCMGILLAGCWDYQELENRAIVVGLGIDELPSARLQGKETRMYQFVVQVVEPANAASDTQLGRGYGSNDMKQRGYTNFIIDAPSIADGLGQITTRSDRVTDLAHLQLIALGEKVARKGIDELYDYLTRFPQMRRHTEIFVAKGSVFEFFTVPSVSEPTPALHLAEIVNNVEKTLIKANSNLGAVSKGVREKTTYVTLCAYLDKNKQVVMNKAAVFNDFKMRGVLSKNQIQVISILQGDIHRGLLEFSCSGGKKVVNRMLSGNAKVKPSIRNGKPHVTFQVKMETEMVEYQCMGEAFEKPEQISKLEKKLSGELKKRLMDTVQDLQAKYKADFYLLNTKLKNYPELHKMIREQPKEFFQQLTVDVEVDFKIRNLGNSLDTPQHSKDT